MNTNTSGNKIIGKLGEDFAAKILMEKGYVILKRNFRCKFGEIDIIACRNNELCFIEVKTRRSLTMGRPAEAVTSGKKRKIRQTAELFIAQSRSDYDAYSFHVVEVLINHMENVF